MDATSRRGCSPPRESKESEILPDSKVSDFFCPCLHHALLPQAADVGTRFRAAGGTSLGGDSLRPFRSASITDIIFFMLRTELVTLAPEIHNFYRDDKTTEINFYFDAVIFDILR